MKRILSYLVICALLVMPVNSLLAASNDVSFFEALGNFSGIEDYKLIQSFYGNVDFEEDSDHISAEYRISVSSVVDGGSRTNNFSRVSVFVKLTNHNEATDSTPFKEMTIQANGEVITRNQKDVYFKLNNFNIGLTESLPFAVMDVENILAMADLYRGTWFHTSATELATNKLSEKDIEIDVDKYMALENKLKEEPKEAIIELSELALKDSNAGFSKQEMNDFLEGISLALNTKIFTEREVVAGRNMGFKFFNLNKGSIIKFMGEMAKIFGEKMSPADELMIRTGLSKVSLSGIYRIEEGNNLIDNLLIRFRLKDVGPMSKLELNYRYKLSDIHKENSIKPPTEYEEWYGFGGNFEEEMFYEGDF